jgi:hypothetical protein
VLSGYIKGENINAYENQYTGANLSILNTFDYSGGVTTTGTFDWKKVCVHFQAPASGEVDIACRLGFYGSTATEKLGSITLQ